MIEDPRRTLTLFIPYDQAKLLLDAAEIGLEGAEDNLPAEDVALLDRAVTNLRKALEPDATPTVQTYPVERPDGRIVNVTVPENEK